MSGHGKRKRILRANATRWRDRVCADMATATGCAALSEHRLSIQFVNDVIDAIAGCIAAGDDLVVNPAAGVWSQSFSQRVAMSKSYQVATCSDPSGLAMASCSGRGTGEARLRRMVGPKAYREPVSPAIQPRISLPFRA
jgi:hypothetical protein